MRRIVPVLAFVFVFSTTALVFAPAEAQNILGDQAIEGQICYRPPGEPFYDDEERGCWEGLGKATVQFHRAASGLQPEVDESFTTEDWGYFSGELPQGDYTVTVTRAGFVPLNTTYEVTDDNWFEAFVEPREIDVTGRVIDVDGVGIAKATVQTWAFDRSIRIVTDQAGSFDFRVFAGRYSLDVSAPGFTSATYERFLDGSGKLDLTVKKAPDTSAVVKGVVRDQEGDPVEEATVRIYQYEGYHEEGDDGVYYHGYGESYALTEADGSYEVAVRAGEFNIDIRKEGYSEFYEWGEVKAGGQRVIDAQLLKYPDKTAHVVGRIVDAETGKGIGSGSINVQHPEYGLWACSMYEEDVRYDKGQPEPARAEPGYASSEPAIAPYPYYDPGCDLVVSADGTFSGNLTPGYSIFNVWHDHWRTCDETHHADGSYERSCGPEYYGWSGVMSLVEGDNELVIPMQAVPRATTVVQGYVVDADSQKAITDARISFSNQDGRGYGWAETDGDGSYKIRLRGGYHQVSVWVDGYFPWEGTVSIPADGKLDFDAHLTKGEAKYRGGCCYAYHGHDDVMVAYAEEDGASSEARPATAGSPQPAPAMEIVQVSDSGSDSDEYQDLGGGLGPYDAEKRKAQLEEADKESPTIPIVMLLASLVALVALRRRS